MLWLDFKILMTQLTIWHKWFILSFSFWLLPQKEWVHTHSIPVQLGWTSAQALLAGSVSVAEEVSFQELLVGIVLVAEEVSFSGPGSSPVVPVG